MDLSKAFDHDLLIAYLHAYCFDINTLKLLHSYLTKRSQRTKVNFRFYYMVKVVTRCPSRFFLGPILFNIYLNGLFYLTEMTQVCNFANEVIFNLCDKDQNTLINKLDHYTSLAVEWFGNNIMKLNHHKSFQKQPFRGAIEKRRSENMQQIYRRKPMPKCDFNKVALQHTSAWVFSCKFAAYFQNAFS